MTLQLFSKRDCSEVALRSNLCFYQWRQPKERVVLVAVEPDGANSFPEPNNWKVNRMAQTLSRSLIMGK
jgi:hypothetical protein